MMSRGLKSLVMVVAIVVGMSVSTFAASTIVESTACVYFAGQTQPDLEIALVPTPGLAPYFGDTAVSADTLPPSIGVAGCATITISAAGEWTHGADQPISGPEGRGWVAVNTAPYGLFGISQPTADLNTLVGVFLTDAGPVGATPAALAGPTLTPALQQAFIIGDYMADIVVPAGATKLYLGFHDGYEWLNNTGWVEVFVEKEVEIDIKPGSFPSSVNLKKKGLTPVAIHTTADFDATTVDPSTVELNGVFAVKSNIGDCDEIENPLYGEPGEPEMIGDGDLDLVVFFDTKELAAAGALLAGDTEATLTGETFGGVNIVGIGDVSIVKQGKP